MPTHYFISTHEGGDVLTLVTSGAHDVTRWISDTHEIHRVLYEETVVTIRFDVEFCRPNLSLASHIATLQLYDGNSCLVFQLSHASSIPESLHTFSSDPNNVLVGVGTHCNCERLDQDYGLCMERHVDLDYLAAERLWRSRDIRLLRNEGLVKKVLGRVFQAPRMVVASPSDGKISSLEQVRSACLGTYYSFKLGKALEAARVKGVSAVTLMVRLLCALWVSKSTSECV